MAANVEGGVFLIGFAANHETRSPARRRFGAKPDRLDVLIDSSRYWP